MSRKIYLASSWRNPNQQELVKVLRVAGYAVYDFKNPAPGNNGFHWGAIDMSWQFWTPTRFRQCLDDPIARKGFQHDWRAMQWADTGILLLPCGRSAHIEAGYFVGAGKPLIICLADGEPELMYKMADFLCVNTDEILEALEILSPKGVTAK